ncbi:MAG: hypothetical protein R2860_17200 [Desulfobacterales bacterium]
MLASKLQFRPRVDKALCTGCGRLVRTSARSRLWKWSTDIRTWMRILCITCFCCQEMCPEKAIQLG